MGTGPSGVAVDPPTHTAFVTLAGTARVVLLDTVTGSVPTTAEVGDTPVGVAVDPGTHTAFTADSEGDAGSSIAVGTPPGVRAVTPATGHRRAAGR